MTTGTKQAPETIKEIAERITVGEDKRCESCRMFDHNACEYGGIDGFCCCADED